MTPNKFQQEILDAFNCERPEQFLTYFHDRAVGATTALGMVVATAVERGRIPIGIVAQDLRQCREVESIARRLCEISPIPKGAIVIAQQSDITRSLCGREYALIVVDEVRSSEVMNTLRQVRASQVIHVIAMEAI